MTLLAWITAAAVALAPGRDHSAIASAIVNAVEKEGCLFTGKDCERRSAALALSVGYRESGLRLDAVGDNGASLCAWQVQSRDRSLLTDANACALEGYRRLRASLVACRGSIAMYAAGTCSSERGKKIDADRKRLALRILEGR
jgi:hypothetical protein